ncbi:MAG: hypothetical protein FJ253_07810 [Phycisphaerae bacterium]|nr:hypothetical protein [Phycisphaerae bacterium]
MGAVFAFGNFPTGRSSGTAPDPAFAGAVFVFFGGAASLFMVLCAALKFAAVHGIARRNLRVLCVIAGALSCISIPWGTVLDIFTFIVLGRPSVMARYDSGGDAAAPPPPPSPS